MTRRNAKKSVLRTASENVVKTAKAVMVMFIASLLIVACAKEQINPKPAAAVTSLKDSVEVLIEHYSSSLRTLTVSATPKDTLVKSDVDYQHTAVMQYSDEAGMRYDLKLTPSAYSYVRQSKERIDVGSELEIPATLVKRQVISDKPFNSGTTLGRDKVEEFTYSDGNVDQVHYGYRYLAIISGGDTLATPHIEFNELKLDSIHVEKYGEWTALDKPHKLTHHYSLSFTTKGVSNKETTSSVRMQPWRIKSVTDVEQVLTGEPTYEERWIGCPISEYEITQKAPTNKGVVTTTKKFPVSLNFIVPELREQASLDSLFATVSTGKTKAEVLGDSVKNADGFTSLTYTGTHTSKNTGKENSSVIESTTSFTYTIPVKFETKWGSYNIKAPTLSFEEGGFTKESVSQDADFHIWKTINTIIPKFGTCTMDALDEVVRIKVGKDKPAVPVDSAYVKGGKGDDYDVLKTVYYSDGSKREYPFSYTGHHSASATNFGDKVTSSLNWSASELKDNGTSQVKDNGKVFTSTTRFEVTYVTTNKKSDASNGVESGSFGFSETHPVVVFVDGQTKLAFDERKVILSGKGATPAANYTLTVKDGVSYKGYTYNMSCGVVFDGAEEADVTSQGLLLMVADEVGETSYKDEYVWSGNTLTATVTKTIDHTFADDEVETYTKAVTVSMSDLSDGRVDAENTSFTVTPSNSEKSDDDKDGVWTITKRIRNYTYDVSNGSVSRQMTNEVVDYVLVFNDGTHSHTFDGKLNVTKADNFGSSYADGDFTVTPLTTTVTAVASGNGAPTLTVDGVTSIYVENKKELSWTLTYTIKQTAKGKVYNDFMFTRFVNGKAEKVWNYFGIGGKFGTYKPDVQMIYVTSAEFRVTDSSDAIADLEPEQPGLGDEGVFTMKNIDLTEDHHSVEFDALPDATGNDKRIVAGHVNRWSYRLTAVDPEYNHSESIDLMITPKTTTHEVKDGVYTRVIEYQLNGETVDTQVGTVNITVQ